MIDRVLKEGFVRGDDKGRHIIGEITESIHKFILEGWDVDRLGAPPRIEEDLSFVPKDREEVVYIYMYKAAQNSALQNSKRHRVTRFSTAALEERQAALDAVEAGEDVEIPMLDGIYWSRPPLYLEVSYMVAVHSKFRSDAERLLGWVLLRLHEATHLVYRPRRYFLPDGRIVDSTGQDWSLDNTGDEVIMEKVGLALTDDLTVGDAINFFTIHEAPYRPYLTYKARCAMEGSIISSPASEQPEVNRPTFVNKERPSRSVSPSGRIAARPKRPTGPKEG
ncbi:MAG: DUF4255 domain-containing protein [Deltaproteobacteria bacterium]|nr:MAG: DUF4255 domain-containing protein [Deltaproteobacteria bacterium]